MKLNATKFVLAAACAVAIIWLFCSLIVAMSPSMSMNMGGYMMHADFGDMAWDIGFPGFLFSGNLWAVSAGALAGLGAATFNKII
jgi:hypothetical protein